MAWLFRLGQFYHRKLTSLIDFHTQKHHIGGGVENKILRPENTKAKFSSKVSIYQNSALSSFMFCKI